jgi:hypothetical protein
MLSALPPLGSTKAEYWVLGAGGEFEAARDDDGVEHVTGDEGFDITAEDGAVLGRCRRGVFGVRRIDGATVEQRIEGQRRRLHEHDVAVRLVVVALEGVPQDTTTGIGTADDTEQ